MRRNQKLVTIKKPRSFDVSLGRHANRDGHIDTASEVNTNVPWSVISHSPDGFNWGYNGSGPADLALNILNAFVPPGTDGHEAVDCWKGQCSQTAWDLHRDFKNFFLAQLPVDGGMILAQTIEYWIKERREELSKREKY